MTLGVNLLECLCPVGEICTGTNCGPGSEADLQGTDITCQGKSLFQYCYRFLSNSVDWSNTGAMFYMFFFFFCFFAYLSFAVCNTQLLLTYTKCAY